MARQELRGKPGALEVATRIVLIVEYDGTRYHGFQWQTNATTIQEKLESALASVIRNPERVAAASRTDSGTHAKGQVVSFRTDSQLSAESWVKALNFYLPEDIAVRDAYEVEDSFDVRRDATSREYAYCIVNGCSRSPLRSRFAHLVQAPLSIDAMNEACGVLIGENDFAPFSSPTSDSTVRTVFDAKVREESDLVTFEIIANSFLRHQIRNTVGGLIKVGLGKLTVEDFWELARSRQACVIGPAAPACGLCLMKVNYPNFPPQWRRNENL